MPQPIVRIDTSIVKLNSLHPSIRDEAIAAYRDSVRLTPASVHPIITETFRTYQRSNLLYQQGRTKPGDIVTYAPGGYSWHNFSLAIDFVLLVNGVESWKVDKNWMIVVKCFKDRGFIWGGDWSEKKRDPPHFEKHDGLTLEKCRSLYNARALDKDGFLIL